MLELMFYWCFYKNIDCFKNKVDGNKVKTHYGNTYSSEVGSSLTIAPVTCVVLSWIHFV